jgi:hypothetical protein
MKNGSSPFQEVEVARPASVWLREEAPGFLQIEFASPGITAHTLR